MVLRVCDPPPPEWFSSWLCMLPQAGGLHSPYSGEAVTDACGYTGGFAGLWLLYCFAGSPTCLPARIAVTLCQRQHVCCGKGVPSSVCVHSCYLHAWQPLCAVTQHTLNNMLGCIKPSALAYCRCVPGLSMPCSNIACTLTALSQRCATALGTCFLVSNSMAPHHLASSHAVARRSHPQCATIAIATTCTQG